jgi:hypothetical protein
MYACVDIKDSAGNTIHNAGDRINVIDATTGGTTYNAQNSPKYLFHSNDEDIQTLSLNDFTYINNRSKTVEMDTTTEPLADFGKEIFVELKSISYSKQYALNVFDTTTTQTVSTATRISVELIKSSNNYCTSNGDMSSRTVRVTNTNRCDDTAGDGRDAFAPNVGTKIFNVRDNSFNTSGVTDQVDIAISGTHNYDVFVKALNSNGAEVGVNRGKNLYFRIATTGQSVPYTTGTGNNQETTYQARYTTTHDLLHGGEGWQEGDYFYVWMKDGYYKVTIEAVSLSKVQANLALVRPNPTPFDTETTITAESILGDIRKGITGSTTATTGNGFTVTQIGTGLHVKRTTNFNASTPVGELLNVVSGKVNDIGDLPSQCKHGMVVEVIHSEADEDNHFVKFYGKLKEGVNLDNATDADYLDGEGSWEECAKPGRTIELKKSTMPVVLIRTEDGNFRLTELDGTTYSIQSAATFTSTTSNDTVTINKPNHTFTTGDLVNVESSDLTNGHFEITRIDASNFSYTSASNEGNHTSVACTVGLVYSAPKWDDALVGDEVTNPEPSFVGKNINKMLFFRNRFCILADENIVLSRSGDFTNFFAKSAIVQIASDPIDISASSEYPAVLYDGIQVNTGLVLFTKNQQFMLTTDSDAFTPLTAKINALSSYNFNFATNPISLGTTIGFLDNAGKYSRFFEMVNVQREGEPQLIEQSAAVARLFEKDLKLISNSRENSVIFFSEENTSTLYGYRYFDQVTERKLAAWFKWTLTGNIQYHCMQDDFLYVVVENNNKNQLLKFAIKIDSNTPTVEEHRVHLDHLMKIEHTGANAVTVTYNSSLNESTFTKPTGLESTNQLAAFDIDSGAQLGRYSLITRSSDGNTLKIVGDWSSQTFMIGYLYTMEVSLPTIYYVRREGEAFRADTRAHTILHRVKFGFGPIGVYETTLKRIGRVDYTETFEIAAADAYIANTAGIVDDDNLRTVPIYDRNINAQLTIKSTHPTPATIHNMTWEGVYTTNNYQRV